MTVRSMGSGSNGTGELSTHDLVYHVLLPRFEAIDEKLSTLGHTVGQVVKRLDVLTERVTRLEEGQARLWQEVAGLKQEVAGLKQGQAGLKQEVAELREGQRELLLRVNAFYDYAKGANESLSKQLTAYKSDTDRRFDELMTVCGTEFRAIKARLGDHTVH